jgi:hypothetical protein
MNDSQPFRQLIVSQTVLLTGNGRRALVGGPPFGGVVEAAVVHQLNTWRQAANAIQRGSRTCSAITTWGRYSRMRRKAASVAGQFDAVRKRGSSTSS